MADAPAKLAVRGLSGPSDLDDRQISDPSLAQIEQAIRNLNGTDCTLVMLNVGDPTPHMGIGGGTDGQYVVYHTPDNLQFFNLINAAAGKGQRQIKAGGQVGDYKLRQLCGLNDALQAAKTYAETGQSDPLLHWEK